MPGEHFGANIKPFCSVSARKEQRARLQLQIVPEEYQMSFRKNHRKSCQNDWKLFAGMHHLPVDCPYMNSETARLKKSKADNAILFVDASKEFVKVTKNNRLSSENINRIVSAVTQRKNEAYFSRLVSNQEVGNAENNYNLFVSTYVEQEDTREKIDIVKLNAEIAEIVAREQVLRTEIDKITGEIEG